MKNLVYLLFMICMISLANSSCEREKEELPPPLGLYKTNSDYFSFYPPSINSQGEVIMTPDYDGNDSRILITEDDTIYSYRVNLVNGYVLSAEIYVDLPFTDVTYKEIVRKQGTNSQITSEILQDRIIDTDPFIEYYEVDAYFPYPFQQQFQDSGYSKAKVVYLSFQEAAKEINLIIAQDKLEESFIRIK